MMPRLADPFGTAPGDGAGGMILRLANPACRPRLCTAVRTMERAA